MAASPPAVASSTRKGSTLILEGSRVDANTVDYSTSVPSDDRCSGFAQAGGIKVEGDEAPKYPAPESRPALAQTRISTG
jgi:hypothetical protein